MTKFEPHGDFSIRCGAGIMHMRVAGATNIEQIDQIGAEVDRFLDGNGERLCGILVELGDHAIMTNDATARCNELIIGHMERGLCAAAFVVHSTEFREFIIEQIRKFYDSVGLRWERFDDAADARRWLEEQIADI
ncbi:hypothetical protein [Nisaea sp.]|uniref:hypothetical protein n=1 Tax=Nisaea sp. TaxID=2024842 RepID=UPI002B2771D9|nr:hypothetical protein [Nisaea sp.]